MVAAAYRTDPKMNPSISRKAAASNNIRFCLTIHTNLNQLLLGNICSEVTAGPALSVMYMNHGVAPYAVVKVCM